MTAVAHKLDSQSATETAEALQALVYNIAGRLAAKTPAKQESLALKSALGDKRAQKKLRELATVVAQRDDLAAALNQARRNLEKARAETVRATGLRLAEELVKESEKFDLGLLAVSQAQRRRLELKRQLAATGLLDDISLSALDCEIRVRYAVSAAGAYAVLRPGGIPPARDEWTPLAVSDRRTLSKMRT
jgi:hypothetical protein